MPSAWPAPVVAVNWGWLHKPPHWMGNAYDDNRVEGLFDGLGSRSLIDGSYTTDDAAGDRTADFRGGIHGCLYSNTGKPAGLWAAGSMTLKLKTAAEFALAKYFTIEFCAAGDMGNTLVH